MKRTLILLLILSLMLSCAACGQQEENILSFYYLRTLETVQYGQADALIAPVRREISTRNAKLDYLLQLYLDGPVAENYRNPFPKGTYLLSTLWNEGTLVLVLSREFSSLDNIQLTLAGACLAATCHALTGAERIQVRSHESIYDFDLNNYTFIDTSVGE